MADLLEVLPAAHCDRCRFSQANIGLRLRTTMEELEEGLKELKGWKPHRKTNNVN